MTKTIRPVGYCFIRGFFQEPDKGRRTFDRSRGPGDGILPPVITAKDVPLLFSGRPGRRDTFLLTDFHPADPLQGRFVHKDELEIVSEGFF